MNTKGHCYPKYIILQAVYFKLRFTLSYRDVEELMKIRGVIADHATIQRWVYKFIPFIEAIFSSSSRYSFHPSSSELAKQSFVPTPSTKGFHCYRG
ncbi:hypothetical protein SAMN04487979_13419 [Flavobacterium sp. ov086]|nr:hypothetical protein SAMN04487979_13419 [Flavobacterium sp. ov086]